MRDLSVIIPARNELFLRQTVDNVLANIRGDTEVIAVCDGYWPDPPLYDNPRLTVIHHDSIGQRAATNEGARVSQAKYVMKLDAHCAVDEGFDIKLMADCQPDWTLIPQMYNLHAFDWVCEKCGKTTYQGAKPQTCLSCKDPNHKMNVIWKPRLNRLTLSYMFDKNLQFQYWNSHKNRPEVKNNQVIESMSFIGACMFLERKRYWELGGMDEAHGSWGQFGTEISCKSWLSGGKLMVTKNTWFAHMFRTGNFSEQGGSTWPYPIQQSQINDAREYSRNLWLNDRWPQAIRPLSWLVEHFAPVPTWHADT